MPGDIPFNRSLDLEPGVPDRPADGVRRVLANNPGPFTFKGTLTYIVGTGNVAVIDPGPDRPEHVEAILKATQGETVTHIFVTHTHLDHSPAVPALKAATGATVYAEGPHRASRPMQVGEINRLEGSGDMSFRPDVALRDGEVVRGDGWALEAVKTPGHAANHMGYALAGTKTLFVGDHVMGWATSVVAPPDGSMSDYMASLHKLAARPETLYLPGHGPAIPNAPEFVGHYIEHRNAREQSILHRLAKGEADIPTLVRAIYIGIAPRLLGAAGLSVFAHLEAMVARGEVGTDGEPALDGIYRLVG